MSRGGESSCPIRRRQALRADCVAFAEASPSRRSETCSQMAARWLRSDCAPSEASGASDTKATAGRHPEGRCGRRGDLRRGSPHSPRMGGNLRPGRHDGGHAETCPPRRPGPSAPRFENDCPVASCRQREGRSVVQPLPQWRGHCSAALAGKGRPRIRRHEPPGSRTKSLARLTPQQFKQRCQVGQDQIRRRDACMELEAAPVDPGNREAKRLAAHHVGELRLPGVQDLRHAHAR